MVVTPDDGIIGREENETVEAISRATGSRFDLNELRRG
jgi:hypothetical protein